LFSDNALAIDGAPGLFLSSKFRPLASTLFESEVKAFEGT
jgi:hypothetical protein